MKIIPVNRLLLNELFKFSMVGMLVTVVSIILMYLFYNIFNMGYWGSSSLSYFIGSIISLIFNKMITFQSSRSLASSTPRFFINIAVCYVIAYLVAKPTILYLASYLNIDSIHVVEQTALFLGIILFTVLNFAGQKYFVFRENVGGL